MAIFTDLDPQPTLSELGFNRGLIRSSSIKQESPPELDNIFDSKISANSIITGAKFQTSAMGQRTIIAGQSIPGNSELIVFPYVRMISPLLGDFRWEVNSNGLCYLYDQTNTRFNIMVDASGQVGINKETPAATLDVNGQILADNVSVFPGSALVRQAAVVVSAQLQSQTVLRLTISGIANGDSGLVFAMIGGNINTIDRCSLNLMGSYYRSGGVIYVQTSTFGQTGLANISLGFDNASGNIKIESVTPAFGAGQFDGVLFVMATKNTSGLILTP